MPGKSHRSFRGGTAMTRILAGTFVSLMSLVVHAQSEPASSRVYLGAEFESAIADSPTLLHRDRRLTDAADTLRYWNQVAIDASGLDHTPLQPGEQRVFGHQLGPGRASKAIAIVHIAIFDAVNSIVGGYRSYTGI